LVDRRALLPLGDRRTVAGSLSLGVGTVVRRYRGRVAVPPAEGASMTDAPLPPDLYAVPPLTDEQVEIVVDSIADGLSGPSNDMRFGDDALDETKPPWGIRSDREAEWAMRIYTQAAARVAEVQAQANEWHGDISRWEAAERSRPTATMAFMGHHLRAYQAARREADPKAATLRLPSGTVGSRRVSEKVEITDAGMLADWARGNDRWDLLHVEPLVTLVRETVEVQRVPAEPPCYTFSCGHERRPAHRTWSIGDEVWCPDCGTTVMVVEEDTMPVAVDVKSGQRVPGTAVVPEHVEVSEPKPNGGRK
jgi:hypothetical protein